MISLLPLDFFWPLYPLHDYYLTLYVPFTATQRQESWGRPKDIERYVLYPSTQCYYGIYAPPFLQGRAGDEACRYSGIVLQGINQVRQGAISFSLCPGGVVDILEDCGSFDPGSSPGRGVIFFYFFLKNSFKVWLFFECLHQELNPGIDILCVKHLDRRMDIA